MVWTKYSGPGSKVSVEKLGFILKVSVHCVVIFVVNLIKRSHKYKKPRSDLYCCRANKNVGCYVESGSRWERFTKEIYEHIGRMAIVQEALIFTLN